MLERYAHWIIRWRWPVVLLSLLLVGLAGSGASKLVFTADYRVFFGDDNPQLNAFELLQDTYSKNDNVLVVLTPNSGNVFTQHTLEAVHWLTEESWQTPYSLRVDSITNFQHTHADGDDLVVEDLVLDPADLTDERLAYVRDIAVNEPLLRNRLISPDGDVTGVNITIQLPGKNQAAEVPEVMVFARDLVDRLQDRYPHLTVHMTGMVVMNNAFPEAAQQDMKTLIPVMFLVIILMLGVLLRNISGTLGTVLVIFSTIGITMGLSGWAGIRLTPPTMSVPTIVMTLAVADCVHLLVTFLQGMRHGQSREAAMVESLKLNFYPIFLTSLTTSIGFLSLNFSDAPPFRDIGNMVATGVMGAFVLSVTFLPAFMMMMPLRVKQGETSGGRSMNQLAEFVIAKRNLLLPGMMIVAVVAAALVTRNELNDEFVKYFDESIDFRASTEYAAENLTGIYLIDYSLPAGETGGISNPDFLTQVDDFAQWYRTQPEVLHVNSFTDIMRRLNRNLHGDEADWYRIPEQRDLAAQYLLLYEMSLPYGLDLNNQINVDKSSTRFTVTLQNLSSNDLLAVEQRAQAWISEHAPAIQAEGSGPSIMFAQLGRRNINSMLLGSSLALVLISGVLIFALKSFKVGMVSLVPNLIPAILGFGIWGLLIGQVGLALSIVVSMTLGIVVDDTVHFLSKYLRARRERGMSAEDAVRYAFASVGIALTVTSIVLVLGFMVLSLSTFELNSGMGLLTAITIAMALITDFLLLPALLIRFDIGGDKSPQPVTSPASA